MMLLRVAYISIQKHNMHRPESLTSNRAEIEKHQEYFCFVQDFKGLIFCPPLILGNSLENMIQRSGFEMLDSKVASEIALPREN